MATKTVMDTDMVNINQETLFNKVQFPYLVPLEDLKHIHSYIKSLFRARKIPSVQLAGRLKNFIENWKILTNDTEILSLVEGYTIPFHEIPLQKNIPNSPKLSQEKMILVQMEIHEMLNQGAVVETPNHLEREPTSNKLETPKSVHTLPALEDGRFALSLKHSKEGRLYVKTGFEGHILCSSIKSCIQKSCAFLWSGKLYKFLCLCFGLGPAPRIFTKLLKISVSVLRRLNILSIIYLDDMLLIGHTVEETLMTRDTVIFLLQQLGFVLNLKKSVLTPTRRIEFLGVTVDSLIMTLSLPEKKLSKFQKQCQELLQETQVPILELTKEIGLLSSTTQPVLPAQINFRYLLQQQIQALKSKGSYCKKVILNKNSKEELQRWIKNLKVCNGRYLIQSHSQGLIQTDASRKGWGTVCQGKSTEWKWKWSKEEHLLHINVLELKAVKLALFTFNKQNISKQFIFKKTTPLNYSTL